MAVAWKERTSDHIGEMMIAGESNGAPPLPAVSSNFVEEGEKKCALEGVNCGWFKIR
jgi:hypothetical protein